MDRELTFTIDGQSVTARKGETVLQAAREAGIYIPHLCYSDGLEPYSACRLCIVEIDGMRGMPTSCATPVKQGMVVRNDVESVNRVRRMVCEMLIADHPLVCLSCSANMNCRLQDVAAFLGIKGSRLRRMVRKPIVDDSNPFYTRDLGKCILCGLCTRSCHELRGVGAIEIAGRGYESRIAAPGDQPVSESTCTSCGECIDRCPVNALWAKNETVPPTATTTTTCVYCGCGCSLELGTRAGKIVRVRGDKNGICNRGSLCVKGRFGLDFVSAPDRLTTPLIKRNGSFEEATWDEALDLVASTFAKIKQQHGPDALAGLSSAKCTNEENYVFQKFIRAGLGTNNVDHCARLCHASTVAGLARAFGSGAMTNPQSDFEHADCIFVTGSNTTEAHPITAMRIISAVVDPGATLIVADPRRIDLTRYATLHIRQRSGTDVALFNAMMQVIIAEGLCDDTFIAERTEGVEELKGCVAECTPEWAEPITGIPAEKIREAARLYAAAERGSIAYSMGITQHTTGTDNVLALANLAMITGNVGRASTGVNPLRGQNNVQGACDLGALPNKYPGYQDVNDPAIQKHFESAWGASLSPEIGLTVTEIVGAAGSGAVRGLYVMGENPMLSDPNLNHVEQALKDVEFLCVQDIFMTETAALADVVLPAASFAEKDGSFTNTDRRVQRVRAALPKPGEARDDWDIICSIASRTGYPMSYNSPSEILDEIASVSPIYGGMSFERIDAEGLQWPCPDKTHPGTTFLHEGEFKRGKGKFHATPFKVAAEEPDDDYPLLLTTGRYLYHWHTRTMTSRSKGLEEICPPVPIEIHPDDAAQHGIADGDVVEVASRRGVIRADAKVTDRSPRGTVFMAFHFREGAANKLTNDALDPIAKIPEFKVCAVRIGTVEA
ncbi:MAG: formate dehydrogenase subunit alpha [Kiritimatiellae bacterium]|nr:formate dehydrogenase subunit alpha [Kiritimatiellia bacterium]